MNTDELQDLLVNENFDPDSYDLKGGLLPEKYTLSKESGMWCVYYSERGLQSGKKTFPTESEACMYLLEWMRSDPTTKSR
jgi:hypothetical protein